MEKDVDTIKKIDESIDKFSEEIDDNSKTKIFSEDDYKSIDDDIEETKKDLVIGEKTENDEENNEENKEENIEVKEDNNKNNSKKTTKILIIMIIVSLLLVLILVSYIFIRSHKDKVEEDVNPYSVSEQEEIINTYGKALEDILILYINKKGVLLDYVSASDMVTIDQDVSCLTHDIYIDGLVYLDNCSIDDYKTEVSYGKKREEVVVEKDALLKVYVNRKTSDATLVVPSFLSKYDVYEVDCGANYSSPMLLANNSNYVFYLDSEGNGRIKNYKENTNVLSSVNYQSLYPINIGSGKFDQNYVVVKLKDVYGVYNFRNGSQIISPTYPKFINSSNADVNYIDSIGDNLIFASDGSNYGVINYITGKIIIPFNYSLINKSGSYIFVKDKNGKSFIYDHSGNVYLDEYDKIYDVVNGMYVLVKKGEKIKIVQINGKVLYNYDTIDNVEDINYSIVDNDVVKFLFYSYSSTDKCVSLEYNIKNNDGSINNIDCPKDKE